MSMKKVNTQNLKQLLENPSLSSSSKVVYLLTLLHPGEVTRDPYLRQCGLDEFELHDAWRILRLHQFKPSAFRKEFRFEGDNFLFTPTKKRVQHTQQSPQGQKEEVDEHSN